MRPEIRHLMHFMAAAEELNFTRAARRLHVAPQGLSTAIAQLEQILETRLFERSTRRVELTAAGAAYLPYARAVLGAIDEGTDAARGVRGQLRVGLAGTEVLPLTTRLLRAYERRHPTVALEVRHFGMTDPSGGLGTGSSDVALVRPPFNDVGLELNHLTEECRYVVLADDHDLAGREQVVFDELADEPWATVTTDPLWHQFWTVSTQRTRPIPAGQLCLTQGELFEAARAHRAIGLVPASIARANGWPGLTFIRVADVPPSIVAAALPSTSRKRQALEFVELATELANTPPHNPTEPGPTPAPPT